MEQVPGHTNLYRRGAVYYYRRSIPADIKDTYPHTEEKFSLKTKDFAEAKRRCHEASVKVDQKFEAHRQKLRGKNAQELTDEQIKWLADSFNHECVAYDEGWRFAGITETQFDDRGKGLTQVHGAMRSSQARGQLWELTHGLVKGVLVLRGLYPGPPPDSPNYRKLALAIQAAAIKACSVVEQRQGGNVVDTPPEPTEVAPLLSQVVNEWLTENERANWSPKTARERRVWINRFVGVVGDRPISGYKKADGRAFKDVVVKLPSNWNKKKGLRHLDMEAAAKKAHKLGMEPMSTANIDKIVTQIIGSFWKWAGNHYDECPPNPMTGLKVEGKKNLRSKRDPFTPDELQAIFTGPLYTGCLSLRQWMQPGDVIPKDTTNYWVPLIGLWTGARLNEICQLDVKDVKEDGGGVYYLNIKGGSGDDDKKTKTGPSDRRLPIHRELIGLGLLEYVKLREQQGAERLFPDLPLSSSGYYSDAFSKRFRGYLEAVGAKRKKTSFHSLRHNMEDAYREAGVTLDITNALQGHVQSGMAGVYGAGHSLKVLAAAMDKIEYPGLDLGAVVPVYWTGRRQN